MTATMEKQAPSHHTAVLVRKHPLWNGLEQRIYEFPNGYGASVLVDGPRFQAALTRRGQTPRNGVPLGADPLQYVLVDSAGNPVPDFENGNQSELDAWLEQAAALPARRGWS